MPHFLSSSAVSPIIFSIVGIGDPLFRSQPAPRGKLIVIRLGGFGFRRVRLSCPRQGPGFEFPFSAPLRCVAPRLHFFFRFLPQSRSIQFGSAVGLTGGPSWGGASFRAARSPPAPAGRLDLGARRQGLAPEAGRRSNTTQLRRLWDKLLSNTTEGGGRCVVLDRQIIGLGGALCLSPARFSPLGFSAPPGLPTGSMCPAQMSSSPTSILGGLAPTTASFRSLLVGCGNQNRLNKSPKHKKC